MRQDFVNKTVLVTGGSGFLGYNLVNALRFAFDVHFTYCENKIAIRHAFSYKLDVRSENELAGIIEKVRPGVVLHCAALTNTEACEEDWDLAYRTNVKPTYDLLQYARDAGARFIYFSTDMVFDGDQGSYEESDPAFPRTRYGKSKRLAEELVEQHQQRGTIVIRPGLIYGWGNEHHGGFIRWMQNALEEGRPLPLYEDEYRTPIYVRDLVDLVKEMLTTDAEGTFHAGGRERISRYEFGLRFARIFGYDENLVRPARLAEHPGKAPRPANVSLSISRTRKFFNTVLAGVDDGLKRLSETSPRESAVRGGLASH